MLKIFKEKISPILAFILIAIWGYFCLSFIINVFDDFAQNELIIKDYNAELAKLEADKQQ